MSGGGAQRGRGRGRLGRWGASSAFGLSTCCVAVAVAVTATATVTATQSPSSAALNEPRTDSAEMRLGCQWGRQPGRQAARQAGEAEASNQLEQFKGRCCCSARAARATLSHQSTVQASPARECVCVCVTVSLSLYVCVPRSALLCALLATHSCCAVLRMHDKYNCNTLWACLKWQEFWHHFGLRTHLFASLT